MATTTTSSQSFARELEGAEFSALVEDIEIEEEYYELANYLIGALAMGDNEEVEITRKKMKDLVRNYLKTFNNETSRDSYYTELAGNTYDEADMLHHLSELKNKLNSRNNNVKGFLLEFHPADTNYNSHIQYSGLKPDEASVIITEYINENNLSIQYKDTHKKVEEKSKTSLYDNVSDIVSDALCELDKVLDNCTNYINSVLSDGYSPKQNTQTKQNIETAEVKIKESENANDAYISFNKSRKSNRHRLS